MKNCLVALKIGLGLIWFFPHLILFYLHKNRSVILADIQNWFEIRERYYMQPFGFIYLIVNYPEFRTLFYQRIGGLKYFLRLLWPGRANLHIGTKNIGEKLYIHFGYSTIIGAKSIGKNCRIYQQVTVGSLHGSPTILDNVTIYPGAIIIGNITIGNNVIIGINTVVYQDVPDNTTIYPPKSLKMQWGGKKSKVDLSETL